MIAIRSSGSYGIEYSTLFASLLLERISGIEACVPNLRHSKSFQELTEQNRAIESYNPSVVFTIKCNFSIVDDTISGYTVDTTGTNAVLPALTAAFKEAGIKNRYQEDYKVIPKQCDFKPLEILIGIGYASNPLDIRRFNREDFSNIIENIFKFLFAPPIKKVQPIKGVKNKDPYFEHAEKWSEYKPSKLPSDSGEIVDTDCNGIPIKALKLSRAATQKTPFFWFTEYSTMKDGKNQDVIFSAKADRPGVVITVWSGTGYQEFKLTDTNWTTFRMEFKPKALVRHSSSIKCTMFVENTKLDDRRFKAEHDSTISCSFIVDGVDSYNAFFGILSKGSVLFSGVIIGNKSFIGVDGVKNNYSIFPPDKRPNNSNTNTADAISNKTSTTRVDDWSYVSSNPVTDKITNADILEASGSSLIDTPGFKELLESDRSSFSDTIGEFVGSKLSGAEDYDFPPMDVYSMDFNYEALESLADATDDVSTLIPLRKSINLLKGISISKDFYMYPDQNKYKLILNKLLTKEVATRLVAYKEAAEGGAG